MNSDERKQELKRRMLLRKYPTRQKAEFTAANDHNPLVLASCPRCRGYGKYDTVKKLPTGQVQVTLQSCDVCNGSGVQAEVEHYFNNESSPMSVVARADGWLKCPNCGRSFTIADKNAWTGKRHIRCGQKLEVTTKAI